MTIYFNFCVKISYKKLELYMLHHSESMVPSTLSHSVGPGKWTHHLFISHKMAHYDNDILRQAEHL